MNIFVIPSCYRNSINKQMSIFVHEQCESLIKMGHKVTVLDATLYSFKNWMSKTCISPKIRYEDTVKVYSYWVRGFAQALFPKFATSQYRKKINRLWDIAVKNEGKPDVIYAHFTYPSGFCAVELSKKHNVPVAVMEHGSMYFNKKIHHRIINQLKYTVNEADYFFCVSPSHSKRIAELIGYDRDIDVIPNMISSRFTFSPLPRTGNEFVFFSAGNLKKIKQFDHLIRSFCKAFSPDDNVTLRIAGDGEEKDSLISLIEENNRKGQIILLGRIDRDEMYEEYKNCNCFALASQHESFGIVYREAAACGRPIISTQNGGVEHGWSDELGILVPCFDEDKLSQALLDVYKNYDSFSLERISEITLNYCSESKVMKQIEEILFSLTGEKNVTK